MEGCPVNTNKEYLSRLNNLFKENDEIYRNAAKRVGLPDCAFWIFYILREDSIKKEGNILTQSEICSTMYLPKQTVNSAMKKLENDGYIRLFNTNDRRSKQVSLTPKGMALAENTVDRIIEKETDALAGMAADEKETFLRLYQKYNDLLNTKMQTLTDSAGLSAKALEGE